MTTPKIEFISTNESTRETISLGVLHREYYHRIMNDFYIQDIDDGEDHELEGVLQENHDHEVEAEEMLDHRQPSVPPVCLLESLCSIPIKLQCDQLEHQDHAGEK